MGYSKEYLKIQLFSIVHVFVHNLGRGPCNAGSRDSNKRWRRKSKRLGGKVFVLGNFYMTS